ncbi:tyrosine-protein kinase hopscotch [Cataglyphis hispanica]|uniref:tyrosine-protein kinase hopscotch n=1 Tax=Cataglyphis hispanica TaxID=1086592 RepID=UPI0021802579|nr:tyrosine-protein kinase hopscotch [Cataglyphis hispanica]
MKGNERSAIIYVATDEKQLNISFFVGETIEDLCIKICKLLKINPLARHLFALQNYYSKLWFPYGYEFTGREKNKFEFRLRFKPYSIKKLKQIDEQAYNYYFQQVRADIMNNKVSDIVYEKHKDELIGLGVSDMYREMLEKQLPREVVELEYKKYIPKECIKRHAFFVKKPIYNALAGISKEQLDASYVKQQYLQQFENMAPNYLSEEYKVIMNKIPNSPTQVLLRVNREGLKYSETDIDDWKTLCTIEDLCFISIREDNTVEISRKTGIPSYLKFKGRTNKMLMSFVSALDGYYRLSIKWTFNLCTNVVTPTLTRLYKLKCHGPVGKEFAYAKLREKRANKPGTYILRESETEYDVYYIDVCNIAGKPQSAKVKQIGPNDFRLDSCTQSYTSLGDLISSLHDPISSWYLVECLPPSEYDMSPLLICASENIASELAANEEVIALLKGGPRCVSQNQLQICKAFCKNNKDLTPTIATTVHRAIWQIAKDKKLEIVMKILRNSSYTKEFLELTDKWGKLRSETLIRLYGITVAPSVGMLFELVKLGPLDEYLRSNSQVISGHDMVEASTSLATALWHLEENHIVHGRIRCASVFVHEHTDNRFTVKLGDPGLFTYSDTDLPWIPPEFYSDLASAKKSFQADIWALATTMWEIFSKGISLIAHTNIDMVKEIFKERKYLPRPINCPNAIYTLMKECWNEKNTRKQPQALARDMNQIMYATYNRCRPYATPYPKVFDVDETTIKKLYFDVEEITLKKKFFDVDENNDLEEKKLNNESCESSLTDTDCTNVTLKDNNDNKSDGNLVFDHINLTHDDNDEEADGSSYLICKNCGDKMVYLKDNKIQCCKKQCEACLGLMDDISQNKCWFVHKNYAIGSGFYGKVFIGTRIHVKTKNIQRIAIKIPNKIPSKDEIYENENTNPYKCFVKDFKREFNIMKTLEHPNIVQILGCIWEYKCLIMEFVEFGSLLKLLHDQRKYYNNVSKITRKLLFYALDIATGMDYLSSKNIVHRDLAARNILVASETQVKISDFGLAQEKENDYYKLKTPSRHLPMRWYALESMKENLFSSHTDVWSFGVTMYEIFSLGQQPNLKVNVTDNLQAVKIGTLYGDNLNDLIKALEHGIRLPCPDGLALEVYRQIIYPCWNKDSHERPSFSTLCQRIQELLQNY